MLSYQHGYHAGNFADVVKHICLSRIVHYMTQKDKALFYLETHAGRGLYDLQHKQALKTGEFQQGIDLLWVRRQQLPDIFAPYLDCVAAVNTDDNLRYYPGSPCIASHLLRAQDRLFFSELHPQEFEQLEHLPHQGKRVFFNHIDGLDSLKSQLPPIERRGLIFIDPSYEIKTDYRDLPRLVKTAHRRFATGVYCIWYPLVDKKLHAQLLRGLQDIDAEHALRIEFYLDHDHMPGMTGCGLWVINPPHVLQAELKIAFNALRQIFNPGISSYLLE